MPIVNEDHPQCNVPRKAIKVSRQGLGSLAFLPSLTQRVAMLSVFLHRISVVSVNLSTAATTHRSRGPGSASDYCRASCFIFCYGGSHSRFHLRGFVNCRCILQWMGLNTAHLTRIWKVMEDYLIIVFQRRRGHMWNGLEVHIRIFLSSPVLEGSLGILPRLK